MLLDIQTAIKRNASAAELTDLSSRFYTVIPHSFGRVRPPVITSLDAVQICFDNMAVLADIAVAEQLSAEAGDALAPSIHPTDALYESLGAALRLLPADSKEFVDLAAYASAQGAKPPTRIWAIDKSDPRNASFDSLSHRRLLWHGTNVAVVAAILKSGLRIMPHSGGRIGAGIYSASMWEKSVTYTRPGMWVGKQRTIMFLAEVALGEVAWIDKDDPSLRVAPAGKHSVVALGNLYPDPAGEVVLKMEDKDVILAAGAPKTEKSESRFMHSEYVVYNEGQVKLRYLLDFSS